MEILLKVCALATLGILTVTGLRKSFPEMSAVATLATMLALAAVAAGTVGRCVMFIYELAENAGIKEELINPLMKCVGVSVVTKIGGDMCRDSGVSSVATYIELVGGATAISFSIPLMMSVIHQIM